MRKLLLVLSIVMSGGITFGLAARSPGRAAPMITDALYRGEPIPVLNPVPERGVEYRPWLEPGVRIRVTGASGSGTICYYDDTTNLAYVISCGHLWERGEVTADQMKSRNITCVVEVFYQNGQKLEASKAYHAKVLFYSYKSGADFSLMTFAPDWRPTYFPVAPAGEYVPKNSHAHSVGCDHGTEVAHYDVQIDGIQGNDLITHLNSPRPGRSGGGLMNNSGWYIGICWGTSDKTGNGIGYFTPLSVIHDGYARNGYDWVLKVGPQVNSLARKLPVFDKNGLPLQLAKDFILVPKSK